jgi:peptide/nickel transport system ATP-binding protein
MSDPLLEVEDLCINYHTGGSDIRAVTDASFTVDEGEYFGLVGESGSGKSTIAKSIIGGLDDNGEVVSGKIRYKGEEIQDLTDSELSDTIRWKEIALIPQGSMNSLDPIMKLSDQAIELAQTHTDWGEQKALDRFRELFEIVGLPEERINDYPHQFSGGMQQRAIIALALFLEPSLIIADEPTTALDVIMQDQILNYLDQIRDQGDVSMLMITHDISVIFETCDSLAVLHGGQVAESGKTTSVFDRPRHPYSILLQEAFPDIRFPDRELTNIQGQPPQLTEEVDYCTFADRCPWAVEGCRQGAPPLEPIEGDDEEDHRAACIRSHEMEELAAEYLPDNDAGGESQTTQMAGDSD